MRRSSVVMKGRFVELILGKEGAKRSTSAGEDLRIFTSRMRESSCLNRGHEAALC